MDYNTTTGNQDNDSTNVFQQRVSSAYGPGGYYDGNLANTTFNGQTYTSKGTLADIAMYYYKTDLRPAGSTNFNTGIDVSTDNVPTAQNVDQNPAQHMVTFTVGLGVDGYLTYDNSTTNPTYLSADYVSIVNGTAGACVWTPGNVCDWPQVPSGSSYNDDPAKNDDLWHAAINGRGSYLSAKNPQSLLRGLARDLATIQAQVGAAAASATSTPNITLTNNSIYSTTFRTAYWDGELVAQTIDTSTGIVNPAIVWSEKATLITKVSSTSDTRTIYTLSGGALVAFSYSSLDTTAQGWFDNKCAVLSQCSTLVSTDQSLVNSGTNLIDYLRGQSLYADGTRFRSRTDTTSGLTNVLGDLVDSRPAVVNSPLRHYADAPIAPGNQTYATFASNNASRQSVIYVGGNDGMLHAFDAAAGTELWAYVPRMLLSRLYLLSDVAYPTQHQFFVDGSPQVADVLSPSDGLWHTILVAGLDGGGRGYFAFDVTNPTSPVFLWEFCSDSTVCTLHSDANLGQTFGNPVVTKRASDGQWVVLVASGYNNVSPGDGVGHLYELDPFSGAILRQVSTGVGSTTTPSGLARITAMVTNPDTDNTAHWVYGGDLQGNLWRFDLSGSSLSVSTMATLKDAAGKPQPITTRPELGQVNNSPVVYVGTGRMLGVTDLQDPSTLSPAGNWSYLSSLYALWDNGTNLGNPRSNASLVVQTFTSYSATQRSASTTPVHIPTNIGWMVDFPTTGERVNVDMQLVLGTLVVTTNVPSNNNACAAGGDSWLYQFDYSSGGAVNGVANNVVATKTVGALTVGNVVVQLPGQSVKIISTESSGTKVTTGLNTNSVNPIVRRVGWREVPQ
jgi:type IV pilus assembly protein PilY1